MVELLQLLRIKRPGRQAARLQWRQRRKGVVLHQGGTQGIGVKRIDQAQAALGRGEADAAEHVVAPAEGGAVGDRPGQADIAKGQQPPQLPLPSQARAGAHRPQPLTCSHPTGHGVGAMARGR